jgi:VWFA-related protein
MDLTRRSWMLAAAAQQQPVFRASAKLVVVAATVQDQQGRPVPGLAADDFELLDNGAPRRFELESMDAPVSLVVAVETAETSAAVIDKLRGATAMLDALVAGEKGEMALIAYDHAIRVLAPLSRDTTEFDKKLRGLEAHGGPGRMHDAVMKAVEILKPAPAGRRKVLILIGEAKDAGSQNKLDRGVAEAQAANLTVYPLTFSRVTTPFTTRESQQAGPFNLLMALYELARLTNVNAASVYAQHTGGVLNRFTLKRGLEQAVSRVSEDLHLQYLLSFEAVNAPVGVYQPLVVRLPRRPDLSVRHRPGYWIPRDTALPAL